MCEPNILAIYGLMCFSLLIGIFIGAAGEDRKK
jgi:hypothetical protein